MLAVFCSTSVGVVSGIYGGIVVSHGLNSSKISGLTGVQSLTSVLAGIRLLAVVCASQYLMNAVRLNIILYSVCRQ